MAQMRLNIPKYGDFSSYVLSVSSALHYLFRAIDTSSCSLLGPDFLASVRPAESKSVIKEQQLLGILVQLAFLSTTMVG